MRELKQIWRILIFSGLLLLTAIPPVFLVFGLLSKATAGLLLLAVAAVIIFYIGLPFILRNTGYTPKKSKFKKQIRPRKVLNALDTSEMETLEWTSIPTQKIKRPELF